ncbi:hypothetical protein NQ314_016547 [Rhamnusium bicolor]|uniref:DDE Tnp4 domain-containing protein n=1 Tax=Rhamnusium bicolor TaxID=1586634 RepID=A0AAV8WVN8_9CUCU|nr:hypothetical protein NQ314_016547 [Rhamnusium bicolor]
MMSNSSTQESQLIQTTPPASTPTKATLGRPPKRTMSQKCNKCLKAHFININEKINVLLDFKKDYTGGREIPVSSEKALMMSLWYLGQGNLFLVAEKFDVAVSTAYKYTEIISTFVLGVSGAIDGSNIKFKAPLSQQESYIDKNCNHSIKLQIIATKEKIITNIMNVGFPGSVHDSRVFKNSLIYTDIKENNNKTKYFTTNEYHLVGDKAYPLLTWLMTPYKQAGHLQRTQILHNKKHSTTRVVVENAFGILK